MKSHIRGSIYALLLAGVVSLLAVDSSISAHGRFARGAEAIPAGSASSVRGAGFAHVIDRQIPEVARANWARNPIDRFVLAKLEAAGIAPAAPASPEELLRRAYLDLIGLPP